MSGIHFVLQFVKNSSFIFIELYTYIQARIKWMYNIFFSMLYCSKGTSEKSVLKYALRMERKLDDSTEFVFQSSNGKDLMYSGSLNFACLIYY